MSPRNRPDPETLQIALEESRRTVDTQIEELRSIDDKAMRTVRIAVIILGFVGSALAVGGPSAVADFSAIPVSLGAIGVGLLLISAIMGAGTYSWTGFPFGISEQRAFQAGSQAHDRWLVEQIDIYQSMADEIAEEVETNAEYCDFATVALIAGSLLLLYTTGLTILNQAYGLRPSAVVLAVVVGVALITASIALARNLMGLDT